MNAATTDKVNAIDTPSAQLVRILDDYVHKFNEDRLKNEDKAIVLSALSEEQNPAVFRQIAADVWDKYSSVDVELVISVLRHWLAIEPESAEAKRALGSYMLAHGPEWDAEATALLEEAG